MAGTEVILIQKGLWEELCGLIGELAAETETDRYRRVQAILARYAQVNPVLMAIGPGEVDGLMARGTAILYEDGYMNTVSSQSIHFNLSTEYVKKTLPSDLEELILSLESGSVKIGEKNLSIERGVIEVFYEAIQKETGITPEALEKRSDNAVQAILDQDMIRIQRLEFEDQGDKLRLIAVQMNASKEPIKVEIGQATELYSAMENGRQYGERGGNVILGKTSALVDPTTDDLSLLRKVFTDKELLADDERFVARCAQLSGTSEKKLQLIFLVGQELDESTRKAVRFDEKLLAFKRKYLPEGPISIFDAGAGYAELRTPPLVFPSVTNNPIAGLSFRTYNINKFVPELGGRWSEAFETAKPYRAVGSSGQSLEDVLKVIDVIQNRHDKDIVGLDVETIPNAGLKAALGLGKGRAEDIIVSAGLSKSRGFAADQSFQTFTRRFSKSEAEITRAYFNNSIDRLGKYLSGEQQFSETEVAAIADDYTSITQWFGASSDPLVFNQADVANYEKQLKTALDKLPADDPRVAGIKARMLEFQEPKGSYWGQGYAGVMEGKNTDAGFIPNMFNDIMQQNDGGLEDYLKLDSNVKKLEAFKSWVTVEDNAGVVLEQLQKTVNLAATNLQSMGTPGGEMLDVIRKAISGANAVVMHESYDKPLIAKAFENAFGKEQAERMMVEIRKVPVADIASLHKLLQEIFGDTAARVGVQELVGLISAEKFPFGEVLTKDSKLHRTEFHQGSLDLGYELLLAEDIASSGNVPKIRSLIDRATESIDFANVIGNKDVWFVPGVISGTPGGSPEEILNKYGINMELTDILNPHISRLSEMDKRYPFPARMPFQIEDLKRTESGGFRLITRAAVDDRSSTFFIESEASLLRLFNEFGMVTGDKETINKFASYEMLAKAIDEERRRYMEILTGESRGGAMIKNVAATLDTRVYDPISYDVKLKDFADYIYKSKQGKGALSPAEEAKYLVETTGYIAERLRDRESVNTVSNVMADALMVHHGERVLKDMVLPFGPRMPKEVVGAIEKAIGGDVFDVANTFMAGGLADLRDLRKALPKHLKELNITQEQRDVIEKRVLGETDSLAIPPKAGVIPKDAAMNILNERAMWAGRAAGVPDFDISNLISDNIKIFSDAFKGREMRTIDLSKTSDALVKQMYELLIDKQKRDSVEPGPGKALANLRFGNISGFVELADEPMVRDMMPYMPDIFKTYTSDELMRLAQSLKGVEGTGVVREMQSIATKAISFRLGAPYAEPMAAGVIRAAEPLEELASTIRAKGPTTAMIAGGLFLLGAGINKAFVDRLPERERLRDDTSYVSTDGTVIQGGRIDEASVDASNENLGISEGSNMIVNGIKNPISADQIVNLMQNRFGAVDVDRKTKKMDPDRIRTILGKMI